MTDRRLAEQAAGGLDLLAIDRRALQALAVREGIRSLAVFGSTARGEAGPGSDIDVVIDLEPGSQVGLFEHARIAEELAVLFGRPVDLVTRASLKPRFREAVALEAIMVVRADGDPLAEMLERPDTHSAPPHKAVPLIRVAGLSDTYEQAWDEWSAGDDAGLWDGTAGDGLVHDARR